MASPDICIIDPDIVLPTSFVLLDVLVDDCMFLSGRNDIA
jgi:hypothetical protein